VTANQPVFWTGRRTVREHAERLLYVGDVHTDREQRPFYRPQSYQPPLVADDSAHVRKMSSPSLLHLPVLSRKSAGEVFCRSSSTVVQQNRMLRLYKNRDNMTIAEMEIDYLS